MNPNADIRLRCAIEKAYLSCERIPQEAPVIVLCQREEWFDGCGDIDGTVEGWQSNSSKQKETVGLHRVRYHLILEFDANRFDCIARAL